VPLLETDGARVAYTDTGAPAGRPHAPTVLFGHGLLFSGWMFSAQVEALRSSYRCVTVDWRGQGDSPPAVDGRYDMDSLAEDAVELIEHLGVAPVHYVGLSMGGFVGQRVAARRPDLVRSLTLLDTSAEREATSNVVKDWLLAQVYRYVGIGPVRRDVMKVMFGPAFRADPGHGAVVDEWVRRLSACDRNAIRQAVLGVIRRSGVVHEIPAITAPTLVIVGADDVPTPIERARTIAATIPGARLEIVADCGHSSTVEQPEAVTRLLTEFLASMDGSAGG